MTGSSSQRPYLAPTGGSNRGSNRSRYRNTGQRGYVISRPEIDQNWRTPWTPASNAGATNPQPDTSSLSTSNLAAQTISQPLPATSSASYAAPLTTSRPLLSTSNGDNVAPPTDPQLCTSSSTTKLIVDPDTDPGRVYIGAIVYVKREFDCGDALDSWTTGRMGPRLMGGQAIRALGWGHPAVILDSGLNSQGRYWYLIAMITTFDRTSMEDCLRAARDFRKGHSEIVINGRRTGTIKFANCVYIRPNDGKEPPLSIPDGDDPWLDLSAGRMSKGGAVATEAVYEVTSDHLRSYGVRYLNSWEMRLDKESYQLLMRKLGLEEGHYETMEEILAQGPPRTSDSIKDTAKKSAEGASLAESRAELAGTDNSINPPTPTNLSQASPSMPSSSFHDTQSSSARRLSISVQQPYYRSNRLTRLLATTMGGMQI